MLKEYYLGIDIGGTKCAVLAAGEDMVILDKKKFPTETDKGPQHAINLLLKNAGSITGKLFTGISH